MNSNEFFEKHKVKLNEQQMEAVQAIQGPVLLLAVPGSGKTTVLVTRLGYMIYCCNIQPEKILTLTYTIAATRDMSERFGRFFGSEMKSRLEFRTINGICAKVIQYYAGRIGKNAFELIQDEKQIAVILYAIYQKHVGDYPTESDIKGLRTLITYIKNSMLTEQEIKKLDKQEDLPISDLFREYCAELRSRSLMDYDDQMIYAYKMLQSNHETLQFFQEQFPYICVDEAQDTSKIQHALIGLLANKCDNLFMVGDEDQSIYGFRAAYPEALLDFESNHKRAKVLLMEKNFRSNAKIVVAADHFIQHNTMRHKKHMIPVRAETSDIELIPVRNRDAQYACLAKAAKECTMTTAVLYRDNESALPLVDLFEREKIPYRVKNSDLSFFTHRIVLDIQNIMRFALNPYDTEIFMQIYYKIATFLNKATALTVCQISEEKRIPLLDAAIEYGNLCERTQKSCKAIKAQLRLMLNDRPDKAIHRIMKEIGYGGYLERKNSKMSKIAILKSIAANVISLQDFMNRLSELAEMIREKKNEQDCKFILSTIHSSKGLEYDHVYLMDICDGVFPEKVLLNPAKVSEQERKEYEEERRLFYVGVTRAKDRLSIFRMQSGSLFCSQLMKEAYGSNGESGIKPRENFVQTKAGQLAFPKNKAKAATRKPYYSKAGSAASQIENAPEYGQFCNEISQKKTIMHKVYGIGEVKSQNLESITVDFGTRERILSLKALYEKGLLLR